jgi:16S rRNA (uracil1498-N3)-methyltransferase
MEAVMTEDDNDGVPYGAKIRLYVKDDLGAGLELALASDQAHYLQYVMRLRPGDEVALFNGRDGEWRAVIEGQGKGRCSVRATALSAPQMPEGDIWYLFAPVKRARLDYMVQKATELGARQISPVLTRHTMVSRVNMERLTTYAIEAAEQCGRLSVPEINEPQTLAKLLEGWDRTRKLIFCDEGGGVETLAKVLRSFEGKPGLAWAVLIGPEGGFDARERELLRRQKFVLPVSLGPRILRADTAAVAALALWQMTLGDWV